MTIDEYSKLFPGMANDMIKSAQKKAFEEYAEKQKSFVCPVHGKHPVVIPDFEKNQVRTSYCCEELKKIATR